MPRSVRRNVPRANETWAWASPGHAPPPRGVASALQAPRQAPPQRGMSPPKPTACAGCEHGGGSGPSPESHRDVRAASPGDSSALLDSVSEEICFNGNRQNPACRLPTPAGPNAASGLAPHPRRGGCEVLGGGHEEGEGIPGISLLAAPPPSPPLTAYSPALSSRTPCPLPLRPPFAALAPRTGADSSPYPAGGRHRGRRASSKLAAHPGRDTGLPGPRFPHVLSDHLRGRHEDSAGRSAPSLPGTRKALDHVRLRPG